MRCGSANKDSRNHMLAGYFQSMLYDTFSKTNPLTPFLTSDTKHMCITGSDPRDGFMCYITKHPNIPAEYNNKYNKMIQNITCVDGAGQKHIGTFYPEDGCGSNITSCTTNAKF